MKLGGRKNIEGVEHSWNMSNDFFFSLTGTFSIEILGILTEIGGLVYLLMGKRGLS